MDKQVSEVLSTFWETFNTISAKAEAKYKEDADIHSYEKYLSEKGAALSLLTEYLITSVDDTAISSCAQQKLSMTLH